MRWMVPALLAGTAVLACQSVESPDPGRGKAGDGTPNESAAERAVQQYFRHLADWNLPAAYDLLSGEEQKKVPFENFRKACEADRAAVVALARKARVTYSGEASDPLPNATPYVMVVVSAEGQPAVYYGAVPEAGAWRVILTDAKRIVKPAR